MGTIQLSKECDYGNWVPDSLMKGLVIADAATAGLAVLAGVSKDHKTAAKVLAAGSAALCGTTAYMKICRDTFDFNKGGLAGEIHQFLLDHLDWDGEGELLDIGCGAGALSVRCAKAFPDARILGVDTFGTEWGFTKDQCVRNAVIEQVDDRTEFRKADAAHLPVEDGAMDAVVSCFCFHEVKTSRHKPDVVREALRVLKNGGSFAFIDMFEQKHLYGDMGENIRGMKYEGFSEVHYIPFVENYEGLVPKYVQAPWMIHGAGILYGKK